MRKISKKSKVLSLMLAVCLLLSSVFCINVSSAEVDYNLSTAYVDMFAHESGATYDQKVYDYIKQEMMNCSEYIYLTDFEISYTDAKDVFVDVLFENPDIIHVSPATYRFAYDKTGKYIAILAPNYIYSKDELPAKTAELKEHTDKLLSNIDPAWNDEMKALALHDTIITNCRYSSDEKINSDDKSIYTAYGSLVNEDAVCQGYTLGYNYLLNQLGIEAHVVVSEEMNHSWSMVNIDGDYYHVDVTWDDPVPDRLGQVYHQYFLLSDAEILDDISHFQHYNWESDYTATNTKYDHYFWQGINTAIYYVNNCYYHIHNISGHKNFGCIVEYDNGSCNALYNIKDRWYADKENGYYWQNDFAYLAYANGRFYFDTPTSIYSVNLQGEDLQHLYTLSDEQLALGEIYGLQIKDNKVYVSMSESPNVEATNIYLIDLPAVVEPTTEPTTEVPTTIAPTTEPTTEEPTTVAPTTEPTTEEPTTVAPTTEPTTEEPTTVAPTTEPTTEEPTTVAPTTEPTTEEPTTVAPTTEPTTEEPTTVAPTTEPTTEEPTTVVLTTEPTTKYPDPLTVTAKSNIANMVSKLYFEEENTVTITYYLKSDYKLIDGDFSFRYDPTVLRFNREATIDSNGDYTVMPKIKEGGLVDIYGSEEGTARFVFCNIKNPYDFTQGNVKDNVLFTFTFDIVGDYSQNTELYLICNELSGVREHDVEISREIYVKQGVVMDAFDKCETLITFAKPEINPINPTTQPTTAEEDTTAEPITEPTTVEPTTVTPTTAPDTFPPTIIDPEPTTGATTEDPPIVDTSTEPTTENQRSIGDVDNDGFVTIKDATMIQSHIARYETLEIGQYRYADMNGDTDINIIDATFVQMVCARLAFL